MGDALAGRVALVTGASRGIGAAIAVRLAAEGAAVAMVARSLEPGSGGHLAGSLQETADAVTAAGGVALPIVADLSDAACDRPALVDRAAAALGPIDILVNNAAACFYLSIDETSERRLRVAYEVNVITPYLLTKAVVPGMRDRGEGWIVNITSAIVDTSALDSPQQARSSTYAPSKAALDRLTVSFATELRGTGIAVERARARTRGSRRRARPRSWICRRSGANPSRSWPTRRSRSATCDPAPDERPRRAVRSLPPSKGHA